MVSYFLCSLSCLSPLALTPSCVCGGFPPPHAGHSASPAPSAHQGQPDSGGPRAPELGVAGSRTESAPAECRWAADPSPASRTAPAQGHPAGLGLGFLPDPGMGRPWSQGEEGVGCPALCQQGAAVLAQAPGAGGGLCAGKDRRGGQGWDDLREQH